VSSQKSVRVEKPSFPAQNLEGRCLQRLEASDTPLEPQAAPLHPDQTNKRRGRFRTGYNPSIEGSSQLPDLAERKIASMTAMLRTLPSNGTGNSVLSRMLRENRSP
jgi:hypothetical protein